MLCPGRLNRFYSAFLPFLPFFHGFFPVCGLTVGDGFLLSCSLVTGFVAGTLRFHGLDGGVVENFNGAPLHGSLELLLAEGLARFIEVGDVKLVGDTQLVAYHLLFEAVDRILQPQQFSYLFYFFL
jgi:hypothetical protein